MEGAFVNYIGLGRPLVRYHYSENRASRSTGAKTAALVVIRRNPVIRLPHRRDTARMWVMAVDERCRQSSTDKKDREGRLKGRDELVFF